MNVKILFLFSLIAIVPFSFSVAQERLPEKTSFQEAAGWDADYDVRSDVVMVYGVNRSFEDRVKLWREKGYNVQFMTGIAWGEYQDYFTGKFDGKTHFEDGQVERNGQTIWHGKDVPYIVPSDAFLTYMKSLIRRVIDAGIDTIYLEEPEFWARAGYSEAFKKEWELFYGSPWQAQHESPEATYLSSKLKYHLYFKALKEVFLYARDYGESKGMKVRCFVPTHSLVNYSSWQIVSPEASLAALDGMDGYIAQVWTGTAREAVYFDGTVKERVFENAFLEYGSMVSMTAPTKRKMYFLSDPIEDRSRSWDDYKKNYQATFTAELMYPGVENFEVMPWPRRIYKGKFPVEGSDQRQGISQAYATQMQIMVNSLNDIRASDDKISGSMGIAVLLANSMMFQRFPTHDSYEDPRLSNFYGMALPLLKRGIPVETVHMENLGFEDSLKNTKVLIMSYANMKPPSRDVHKHLASWVKLGGVLIYYGRDDDPFQTVREWWNSDGLKFNKPSDDLFGMMSIALKEKETEPQSYSYGKGTVYVVSKNPKELVMEKEQDRGFLKIVREAYEDKARAGKFILKNHLYLRRGLYDVVAVLDESVSDKPFTIQGPLIDLFDPTLPVLEKKTVACGEQAYLYNLSRMKDKSTIRVLATAARIYDETKTKDSYSFIAKSPSNTQNAMRILLLKEPKHVTVINPDGNRAESITSVWDESSKTLFLGFQNYSEGVRVNIDL